MSKFEIFITPDDIYNKIAPEQRELFSHIEITDVSLHGNGYVHIECLALEESINKYPNAQKLIGDWYIQAF